VASFNLQAFGPKKAADPFVLQTLAKIIGHFDVVAVQEVRDRSGLALEELRREVSAAGPEYGLVTGPRLGRSRSKEQYAFLYNRQTVTSLGEPYTAPDPGDRLHREPLSARFSARRGTFTFVLVDAHLDPDDVGREMAALEDSLRDVRRRFPEENDFVLLGDLNADCSYFDAARPRGPFKGEEYRWLIGDGADTTVKATDCAYDRIVVTALTAGKDFAGEAGTYDFGAALGLSREEAARVSDHFPVWARFRPGEEASPRGALGHRRVQ
jgi:endonuclease/exonuclease/phosphatase family metal-dependent hydrolase